MKDTLELHLYHWLHYFSIIQFGGKKHKQLIMVDYTHFVFGQQWQGAKKFTFPLCLSVIICDIFCFCDFYNMLQ